uniref:Uncharacterized protein n=1 Tax=viral metagenome TaxID=1070528 RepID=A0A6M3X514_9ZZZZ
MQVQKLSYRKLTRSLGLALLLWVFLLADATAQDVCFDEHVAGKMVVELERIPNLQQQLGIQESITVELTSQRDVLLETVKIQKEQVVLCSEALKSHEQLAKVSDENCKRQIEAAKPSFWSRLGTHVTAMGIGGIIAAVLVLLL